VSPLTPYLVYIRIATAVALLAVAVALLAGAVWLGWHQRGVMAERDALAVAAQHQGEVMAAQRQVLSIAAKGEQVATATQSAIDAMRVALTANSRSMSNVLSKIPRTCGVGADGLRLITDDIRAANAAAASPRKPDGPVPPATGAGK